MRSVWVITDRFEMKVVAVIERGFGEKPEQGIERFVDSRFRSQHEYGADRGNYTATEIKILRCGMPQIAVA